MDYLKNVREFDKKADKKRVKKLVKYLGIALRSRDASWVAATDKEEMKTVRKKWVEKRLGVNDKDVAKASVKRVAREMKHKRMKSRVTFYYLVARDLGKLHLIDEL